MGFLDTARRTASAARDGLDALRASRAEAARVPSPVTADPTPDGEELLRRARGLGAPDPRDLLSADDAAAVAGVAVGGPRLGGGDDTVSVTYAAAAPDGSRWTVEVDAFHAPPEDPAWSAASHFHDVVAPLLADDGAAAPGLGDAALARPGEVYVLRGRHLLRTAVTLPDGAGDPTAAALDAARRAVARLA